MTGFLSELLGQAKYNSSQWKKLLTQREQSVERKDSISRIQEEEEKPGVFEKLFGSYSSGEVQVNSTDGETQQKLQEMVAGNLPKEPIQEEGNIGVGEPETKEPETIEDWVEIQKQSGIDPNIREYMDNKILPATREEGIPDALAASQAAIEGGRDTTIDNPFGHVRGGEVLDYGTLEDNVAAYAQTLRNIFAFNKGLHEWVDPNDAEGHKWLKENINLNDYELEDILWHLQFTEIPERQLTNPEDPALGVPNASSKRYEGHRADPGYYINDMIQNMPEWRYYLAL